MTVLSAVMMLPVALGGAAPDPGHCTVVTGSGICLVSAADPARPGGPADPARKPRRPVAPVVPTPGPTPLTSVDLSAGLAGKFIDKFGRPVPGTTDVLAANEPRLRARVQELYGAELEDVAGTWHPFRTWVSVLLRAS